MQDIFAADNGNALLVTDERGRAFLLDLSTREARPVLILPWQGEEVFPRKVDSSDVSLPLFLSLGPGCHPITCRLRSGRPVSCPVWPRAPDRTAAGTSSGRSKLQSPVR